MLILPVVVNILYNINIEYRMVLGFIAVGIIIYLSPINHPNMKLTPKESIANKKMATKNVIICILIIIIDELFFSKSIYIMSLYYSIFLTTVLMILAKIIKQEVNNYET